MGEGWGERASEAGMNGLEGYRPTRIRRLYVRGYRSIRELELVDLPPIVIFHGENGSGKSNILRAMALPWRCMDSELPLKEKQEHPHQRRYGEADAALGLRPDDFCKQSREKIQISMEIELGSRITKKVASALPEGASTLELELIVEDVGDGIRWWWPKAQIGNRISLVEGGGPSPIYRLLRHHLVGTSDAYRRVVREPIGNDSDFDLDPNELFSSEQFQKRLYLLATSTDSDERAVPKKIAARLAQISVTFQNEGAPPELAAVRNKQFREYETQITRSNGESIPLSYLGTGEQQLLILLLDVLASRAAIVQIEEPEAHLHKKFMLRLARVLEQVVQDHDVDQLFIATHHHAFAIASQYYDISHDQEHGTRAVLTDRAKAIQHFYEPSPLWDALRSLVSAGLSENAVLFRDENGRPVHAQEVLASIREEGPLARQFAEEMTKTILLSMREDAEFGES